MSMKIKDLIFGPPMSRPTNVEGYAELDLSQYEDVVEDAPAETYIRVAELSNPDGIPDIKKEIYDGNVVIVDISLIKRDQMILERALRDLCDVVRDVQGDIAGLDDGVVITTPTGIKIDRTRISGRTMTH